MDIDKFRKKFKSASENIDLNVMDTIIKLYKKYCSDIAKSDILYVCIEEPSELIQAITKGLRGKLNELNLLEEIADVYIILRILSLEYNFSKEDINKAINVKLDNIKTKYDSYIDYIK